MIYAQSIWAAIRDRADNNVYDLVGSGAPTSGTSGTGVGVSGPGSTYTDYTNKIRYVNVGTLASPTWYQISTSNGALTSATNAITAHAGGGQGSAYALVSSVNRITTVTTAADSVLLPASTAGMIVTIINDAAANAANIYPYTGDAIDGLSANAAISLRAKATARFFCAVAGTWNSHFGAGGFSHAQSTVAAPTLTTSGTYVMMGLAGAITPVRGVRVLLNICGDIVATNGNTATAQLSYGTSTAPSNGAAVTGTQIGSQVAHTALTGMLSVPFSLSAVIAGLTPMTAYWLDLALKSSSGNVSVTNLSVSAIEL